VTPVLAYVRDGAATWVDLTVIRAGGVRLRVYDVDGNPVADARATLVPLGEAARFIDPKSLRLGTRYTGQPEALRRAVEQLSRTDATGFVGYAGVPPGDYRVELRHETLGASDLTLRVRSGEPELVEVTLDY